MANKPESKKKTAPVNRMEIPFNVRIPNELHDAFAAAAAAYGSNASAMIRMLMDAFVRDSRTHGKRMVYPPEFNHYPSGTKTSSELL